MHIMKINYLSLCLLLVFSGCFWAPVRQIQSSSSANSSASNDVSVEILNALKPKKVFVMDAFLAGSEAEAGEPVDRFALMLIKGAVDASDADVVISAERRNDAGYHISGHIEQFKLLKKIPLWQERKVSIVVKGEITDIKSKEVVAIIYAQKTILFKKEKLDEVAYDIGRNIAARLKP
nr:hypothetical protein JG1_0170 [uncultured bacterium]